jgi:hypothetical protein
MAEHEPSIGATSESLRRSISRAPKKPLRRVVASLAERLERAEPEFVDVAVMWLDVIADFRRRDDAALETERTKRVFAQLLPSDPSPASGGVPLVPFRRFAANTHWLNLSSAGYQASRRAVRRTDGRMHSDIAQARTARCLSTDFPPGRLNTAATAMASGLQVLFGEFAKLIGNGPRRPQHD